MGLDTTHECWHGSYSSFHRWRCALIKAAGLPDNFQKSFADPFSPTLHSECLWHDPLGHLILHSDADGELPWAICDALADRLESLLPAIEAKEVRKTKQFIEGLRRAAFLKENVEFA